MASTLESSYGPFEGEKNPSGTQRQYGYPQPGQQQSYQEYQYQRTPYNQEQQQQYYPSPDQSQNVQSSQWQYSPTDQNQYHPQNPSSQYYSQDPSCQNQYPSQQQYYQSSETQQYPYNPQGNANHPQQYYNPNEYSTQQQPYSTQQGYSSPPEASDTQPELKDPAAQQAMSPPELSQQVSSQDQMSSNPQVQQAPYYQEKVHPVQQSQQIPISNGEIFAAQQQHHDNMSPNVIQQGQNIQQQDNTSRISTYQQDNQNSFASTKAAENLQPEIASSDINELDGAISPDTGLQNKYTSEKSPQTANEGNKEDIVLKDGSSEDSLTGSVQMDDIHNPGVQEAFLNSSASVEADQDIDIQDDTPLNGKTEGLEGLMALKTNISEPMAKKVNALEEDKQLKEEFDALDFNDSNARQKMMELLDTKLSSNLSNEAKASVLNTDKNTQEKDELMGYGKDGERFDGPEGQSNSSGHSNLFSNATSTKHFAPSYPELQKEIAQSPPTTSQTSFSQTPSNHGVEETQQDSEDCRDPECTEPEHFHEETLLLSTSTVQTSAHHIGDEIARRSSFRSFEDGGLDDEEPHTTIVQDSDQSMVPPSSYHSEDSRYKLAVLNTLNAFWTSAQQVVWENQRRQAMPSVVIYPPFGAVPQQRYQYSSDGYGTGGHGNQNNPGLGNPSSEPPSNSYGTNSNMDYVDEKLMQYYGD